MTQAVRCFSAILFTTFGLAACGDEGFVDDGEPFELTGVYANSFNQELILTQTTWGIYDIIESNNFSNRVVFRVQLPSSEAPVYGRIIYTEPDRRGGFFYCFEVSSTDSLSVARNAQVTVDASDPARGGCGDFPWAQAWPAVAIRGDYTLDDELHTITATAWQRPQERLRIVAWDNDRRYGVAQNPSDAPVHPSRYRLIEWVPAETQREDGTRAWWVCDTRDGFPTAAATYSSTTAADRSDPASGGCRGGPWDRIEPLPPS